MKFLVAFGTRPEVIKLAPVIHELKKRNADVITLSTGQHRELLDDVRELIPTPDIQMNIEGNLVDMLKGLLIYDGRPEFDCAIVQGDTTSAFGVALAAFYAHKKVVHIEAGLRSGDLTAPWPEEGHRRMIDEISDYLYCPSMMTSQRVQYYPSRKAICVGNTALDMVRIYIENNRISWTPEDNILVTVHRREGMAEHGNEIFSTINELAELNPHIKFVWPIHPNPMVQACRHLITADNIKVIPPMRYGETIECITKSRFVMSDSGGLQEEAPYLGKRVVILRDTTERTEAVSNGSCILGGTNRESIMAAFKEAYQDSSFIGESPYGDGHAAEHIVKHLLEVTK